VRTFVAGAVASSAVASIVAAIPVDSRAVERFLFVGVIAVYLLVGLVLIERRRGNPLGPVVLTMGILTWGYVLADVYVSRPGPLPGADIAAWVVSLLDAPLFVLVSLVFLVFPDGRLPSRRWRALLGLNITLLAIVVTGTAVAPGTFSFYPQFENRFAVQGFPDIVEPAYLTLLVSVALSALSLVGRWRAAGPVQRAQLKWVASSAVIIAAVMGSYGVFIGPGEYNPVFDAAVSFGLGFFPIAIGIAILRYRLFEIDRLVSRTIAYVVVTAVLVAAYAGVILLLQGPLGAVTGGDTIPVAISTLVVAALFQPLRRRVHSLVDRRFDRARFDSERTSAAFAERLRRDVDIESVTADLRATVQGALRPTHQGLWIRKAPG
jgi:hypothetical protein